MKAVSIDYNKCNTCSICIETSAGCFSKKDDRIEVIADDKTCVLCGHCVAACPSEAITHNIMDMKNFPKVRKGKFFQIEDFIQYIRERRSHRAFLKKPISKEDLEKLIDAVRYSPTGHNEQTVELIIVQNPQKRKTLSNLAVDFYASAIKKAEKDLEDLKSAGKASPAQVAEMEGMVQFFQMIVQARDAGVDPILYDAPAVAIFHSAAKLITPKDNCIIAATTMGLLARTLGLETTFIAMFESAANSYPPLIKELGLPEGNKVFGVLVIGYPKIKYSRTVDRKPVRVRWE
jgi:nitroreductase/NAD-dependent dihydropyrimidine dehydrogenase PreA subunit